MTPKDKANTPKKSGTSKSTTSKQTKHSKPKVTEKNISNIENKTLESTPEAKQLTEIRHLLFGEQLSSVQLSIEQLGIDLTTKIEQLSTKMESELASFQVEVETNLKQLIDTQKDDSFEHENREQDIESSLLELNNCFSDYQKTERQRHERTEKELKNEIQRLSKELNEKHLEAMKKLQQASSELKDNKADKSTLATMLSNMALNLQEQKS